MKSTIHSLLIRLKDSCQLSNKICFVPPFRAIINGQRMSHTCLVKPEQYNSNRYRTAKKINLVGYCLLSVPIGAFILGTWQIQRLQWKLNLIETLSNRISRQPVELLANLENLESMEYYPIKAKGTFLYDKEFIIGYRTLIEDGKSVEGIQALSSSKKSQRGYHVITPFKLANEDLTILINRGWVPHSLRNLKFLQESQITGETEIVGILRLNEERPVFVPKNNPHTDIWHYRDVNAMAEKVDASPIYLEMTASNNMQQYPVPGQTKVELRNEHLSYIVTWYGLSAATAFMWYQKFMKRIAL